MAWFKKQKEQEQMANDSRVEVVAHKLATKQVVNEAKVANEQLKNLLENNGFTIKIFLAAGGKTKRNVKHEH